MLAQAAGDKSTMRSVQSLPTRMVQRVPVSPPASETSLFALMTRSVTYSRGVKSVHRDEARWHSPESPRGSAQALTYNGRTLHYPSPRSGRPELYNSADTWVRTVMSERSRQVTCLSQGVRRGSGCPDPNPKARVSPNIDFSHNPVIMTLVSCQVT